LGERPHRHDRAGQPRRHRANPTFIHVASGFPNGVAVDGAHVYGTVPDKKLTAASAEDLVAEAAAVGDALGCGTS